jgi:transposase-like protein
MLSSPSQIDPAPRRIWPPAEKRRIVELTLQPGASVKSVAKEYRLDPPTLSSWRTLYHEGALDDFAHTKEAKKRQPAFFPFRIHANPEMKNSGSIIGTMQMPSGIIMKIEAEALDFESLITFAARIKKST